MKLFQELTINRKLLLLNLIICGAVLFVAVAALFVFQVLNFRANFQRDTATLAAVVANNSSAALAFKDASDAAEVVNSFRAKPTVVGALLVTPDDSILARYGQTNDVPELSVFPKVGDYQFTDGHLLHTASVEMDGKRLGTLYLKANYRQTFLSLIRFYGLVLTGIMTISFVLAGFLSSRLGRIIIRPVLQLAHTAQIVGEKKDYSVRAPQGSQNDELGRLTAAFNQMLSRIEAQDQALKESRERFEVAIAGVNDGIWDWNIETNEVFFSPQWKHIIGYEDEEIENKFSSFESLIHPDDRDSTMAVLKDYLDLGRSTYEVEFRMREKSGDYRWILARGAALRDADHKPYRMAGSHTDINDRKRAEVEVRAAREKFESLVNSIEGIVWEADPDTWQMLFVSNQAETILGYSAKRWIEDHHHRENCLHPDDRIKTVEACKRGIAGGKPFQVEYRAIAADGRTVWLQESISILVEDGKPMRMRGLAIDITQQKLAEVELARLNSELVTTSRQAGMAEVATGVLHNVGNVLTSVNVSATVVRDRLQRSKITNLCRATAMLRTQKDRLAEFLTTDPKGKLLPDYIDNVADLLVGEQTELIKEMDSVGQHVEHIKEIVAMQQNYAKVSGALENMAAAGLVDDALQMNAESFERHRIQVVREYDENAPSVCVDRHKVLQILINLLRNAKHAMDGQKARDKRLVIRVKPASPDHVIIAICDNGIGIASENMLKIFTHGFTTKKDGHGFGLHSGANAAKELGGDLKVHSEGIDQGSTFTLELPVGRMDRKQDPVEKLKAA